jgi:uracil-DNA glycosylase family 4
MFSREQELKILSEEISNCQACKRLRKHCREVARLKRKSYADQTYWGRPISGFGDPKARLLVVGLAPAAHGANRTGRIFTGDRSGDWLYRAMHRFGFANQAQSINLHDGLRLNDAFVSCVARCAPPENKPTPAEVSRCLGYLSREIPLLGGTEEMPLVFIALGQIALKGLYQALGPWAPPHPLKFGHGNELIWTPQKRSERLLITSYHPSQQNTFTGRLTEPMFDRIFERARKWLSQ